MKNIKLNVMTKLILLTSSFVLVSLLLAGIFSYRQAVSEMAAIVEVDLLPVA